MSPQEQTTSTPVFQQQFEIPPIPDRCAGCEGICALVENINVSQQRIDRTFGDAASMEGLLAQEPALGDAILRGYTDFPQQVRNGEFSGTDRRLQQLDAEQIADMTSTCTGLRRGRCHAYTPEPILPDPDRRRNILRVGGALAALAATAVAGVALSMGPRGHAVESTHKTPNNTAQDSEKAVNGSVQTSLGELIIKRLELEDPKELVKQYLATHPEARGVYLGIFDGIQFDDGSKAMYGGYAYSHFAEDVKTQDMLALDKTAHSTLPEDFLPTDTLAVDPGVTLSPKQRILVQIAHRDGTVTTELAPIQFRETFDCGAQVPVYSAYVLSRDARAQLCAAAGITLPFQGGEMMTIAAYGPEAFTSGGPNAPLAGGPFYRAETDTIAVIAPFDKDSTVADAHALVHETTHDIYQSLSPEARRKLAKAYELMEAASNHSVRPQLDPLWMASKESTYYCEVDRQCESLAGHPFGDATGNELFASTTSILSGFSETYPKEYQALMPQQRMAQAAAMSASLHALYTMNQDLAAFDHAFPAWRKTVKLITADVLQNLAPNQDISPYEDLFTLATLIS